jgi:hypothetical protein
VSKLLRFVIAPVAILLIPLSYYAVARDVVVAERWGGICIDCDVQGYEDDGVPQDIFSNASDDRDHPLYVCCSDSYPKRCCVYRSFRADTRVLCTRREGPFVFREVPR